MLPDDREHVEAAFRTAAEQGTGWHFECRIRRADDGGIRWIAAHSEPQIGDDGRVVRLFGLIRDITDQRQAQEQLREETRTLEIINRTGGAIAAELDLKRLVQMVTDAGVELTGAQFGAFFYNVLNEMGERLMLYTLSGAERSAFESFGMPRATAIFQPTFKGEGVIRSDDITARTAKSDALVALVAACS